MFQCTIYKPYGKWTIATIHAGSERFHFVPNLFHVFWNILEQTVLLVGLCFTSCLLVLYIFIVLVVFVPKCSKTHWNILEQN